MNSDVTTLGFLGAGRMARALAHGIAEAPEFADMPITFYDPSDEAADAFETSHSGARRIGEASQLATQANVLVLAVKPQVIEDALQPLLKRITPDHLIVSICAGVPIEWLGSKLPTKKIVRVMPNTPCLIGEGISAMACRSAVTVEQREWVKTFLNSVGQVVEVAESQMDAVTGLSGSGPAFVFYFIETLIDGGIAQGLERPLATRLALQTVYGAASLARASEFSLDQLRQQVTSPGGTTMAGLAALRNAGFPQAIEQAIEAATQRSAELARL